MKLIIENIDDEYYAYVETEKHHSKVKTRKQSGLIQNPRGILNENCCLEDVLKSGQHMIFDLK